MKYQEETGHFYNLEATPAEGVTYRFARSDKAQFPEIKTAGKNEPYYTNSVHLPVSYTDDLFEVLDHQDSFRQNLPAEQLFICSSEKKLTI